MDNQSIITYKSAFDAIMHEITADDGSQLEVWYARELQKVCGYARWENFQVAINRAIDACKSQNINIDDHFRDVTKMVSLGTCKCLFFRRMKNKYSVTWIDTKDIESYIISM